MTGLPRFTLLAPFVLACAASHHGTAETPGKTIVGAGDHRYRWDEAWPKLPDDVALGNTHGHVVADTEGNVYFNTDSKNAVLVIGPDGTLERAFGEEWAGGLHGMTLVTEGDDTYLYVAHTARHEVAKLTLRGDVVWTLGWPEPSGHYEDAAQYKPTAVAVRPDGGFYVADGYGRSWVHEYDADRNWVRALGGPGEAPGQMRTPHGLFLDTADPDVPLLVVADRENHRLQRFTLDGALHDTIEAELRRPCNVDRHGDVYAVADLTGRVTLIDAESRDLLAHLGEQPDPELRATNGVEPSLWRVGRFLAPHGIAFGPDGALYVEDWNQHGRVTRLEPLGAPGAADGG